MDETKDVIVETPTDTEPTVEPTSKTEAEIKLEEQNKKLFARAKAAEDEVKKLKNQPTEPVTTPPTDLADELRLTARGLDDDEIDQARVISKGKGIPLSEAVKDPLFITYQTNKKELERKEKAKLGATKGSGPTTDNSLIKPDMTRDEHMEAFKKMVG